MPSYRLPLFSKSLTMVNWYPGSSLLSMACHVQRATLASLGLYTGLTKKQQQLFWSRAGLSALPASCGHTGLEAAKLEQPPPMQHTERR